MILIKTEKQSDVGLFHYAASTKAIPGLVQEIAGEEGIEATIKASRYFEFNTRTNRTGEVGPFLPLSDLVAVSCGLVRQETNEDEDEDEDKTGDLV
jgi:hypothetical protein